MYFYLAQLPQILFAYAERMTHFNAPWVNTVSTQFGLEFTHACKHKTAI